MLQVLRLNRARIALIHDLVMVAISFPLSLYLRVGDLFLFYGESYVIEATLMFTAVAAPVFWFSKLYRGIWRYASIEDLVAITKAVSLAILIFLPLLVLLTRLELVPRSLPFINWFVLIALLGGPRFLYRLFKDRRLDHVLESSSHRRVPVLLVGAGDEAELFIRQQNRDRHAPYRVIAAIDEKGNRVGRSIHNVPVLGELDRIEEIIAREVKPRPERLILTKQSIDGAEVRQLLTIADRLGLTLSRLPKPSELRTEAEGRIEAQPIAVEDLLGRPQALLDRGSMQALIRDRRILVTGAGGTIGRELVRQISDFGPTTIALLDNSEFQLYEIDQELASRHPDLARRTILGDVRDRTRVDDVIARERPELVFHAAALKHVPMVEANPMEGVLTNAVGSRHVADACRAAGVRLMVQISTDKAVNPSSVMGATKRLAESYCQALDLVEREGGETRFVTVRFGNVLGSTGSVVPLFQRQIEAGGPLTVTHPDVTRYFMTTREAVELVLQASALGEADPAASGKIYVLDMGEAVKVLDLAQQMIRLAGLKPNDDVKIEFIGLRPGEKLEEELLHDDETLVPTACPGLLLASPRTSDLALLQRSLDELEDAARGRRREQVIEFIRRLVPEYNVVADDQTAASL
ncbi:MAG: nucleoside-diphosphate sugar epimerase/dehydratase [Alphaproteobacteria bacterium]|jgi:O-antigen biosynthesis protein WbqV|nr:nucleoside-diphosphate sugar epimerase/dehydratase [Alphaproteobacteria bacterium]